LEDTFQTVKAAEGTEKKIRKALKEKRIPKAKGPQLVEEALKANVITQAEAANLKKAEEMRYDAITVDDFTQDEYLGHVAVKPAKTA
jgi:acyl-CoA dehydrogenase